MVDQLLRARLVSPGDRMDRKASTFPESMGPLFGSDPTPTPKESGLGRARGELFIDRNQNPRGLPPSLVALGRRDPLRIRRQGPPEPEPR